MKEISVAEVFCEVLSGLAIMFFMIPLLDVIGKSCIHQSFTFIGKNLSATAIGGILVLAYILGLVMDTIGLAVGELFLDRWLCKDSPSAEEKATFWKKVPAHVLGYRDTQWAYVSAYRNLAILALPGGILWCWSIGSKYGCIWALGPLVGMIILELVLLKTIAVLLKIYCGITKSTT